MTTASAGSSVSKYKLGKKKPTFEYGIHWNITIRKIKFLYEKVNGGVGWNKHTGEQN